MSSPSLAYDVRFASKKRIWIAAVAFLIFMFALPIRAGIGYQHYTHQPAEVYPTLRDSLANFFSSGDIALVVLFIILAFFVGLLSFADIHRHRQVDFYNSLPTGRAHIFAVNFLSGFLAVAIPYLINLLLALLVLVAMGHGAFISWGVLLGGALLHLLFFLMIYATVVLASVLCGNLVISGILSVVFLAFGPLLLTMYRALRASFQPNWYEGLTDWGWLIGHSSPAARYIYGSGLQGDYYNGILVSNHMSVAEAILLLAITAVIIGLALLLFRRRPAEAAERALAFPKSRPWLKYPIMLLAAATFAVIFHMAADMGGWVWYFIGALLGGFIAAQTMEIIYHADFRAIGKKLLPAAVVMVAFCGVSLLFIADVFRYADYVPEAEDVTAAEVRLFGVNEYDPFFSTGSERISPHNALYQASETMASADEKLKLYRVESKEGIAAAVALATAYVQADDINRDLPYSFSPVMDSRKAAMCIRYTLANGKQKSRVYYTYLPISANMEQLRTIYADPEYRMASYGMFAFPAEDILLYNAVSFEKPNSERNGMFLTGDMDMETFLAVYQNELASLDVDYLRSHGPVGTFLFMAFDGGVPELSETETYWRYPHLEYNYPVYAACTGTLALLEQYGYPADFWRLTAADVAEVELVEYTSVFASPIDLGVASATDLPADRYGMVPDGDPYDQKTTRYSMPEDEEIINELLAQSLSFEATYNNALVEVDPMRMISLSYRDSIQDGFYARYLLPQ